MSLQLGISLSTTWVESRVLEFVLKDGWIYPQCGLHHVLLLLLMIPACSSFTKYTIYCNYCCYCLLIPYWHCVSMEYVSLHIYIYISTYTLYIICLVFYNSFLHLWVDSSNYSMFQQRPEALPESGRDLDELAELVLSELQSLRHKVAADG